MSLTSSPWVPGHKAMAYMGEVHGNGRSLEVALRRLQRAAWNMGATWVISVRIDADPFVHDARRFDAIGTAARLDRL